MTEKENLTEQFIFFELQESALTPGKPFAGFAVGKFVDMMGREVEFGKDALADFLTNTLSAIKAAVTKGMPGLPIDARQHDKGDAAGWITGAELGEVKDSKGTAVPVIKVLAEWTKLGVQLIKDKVQTNFSPTVDLKNKVIRGGSLTNWPASVDENGTPLFEAVELAQGVSYLKLQESLDDVTERIRRAWNSRFEMPMMGMNHSWVSEVFEGYVIAYVGQKYYRISYQTDDGDIVFADREDWQEVKQEWVNAEMGNGRIVKVGGGDAAPDNDEETVIMADKNDKKTPDKADEGQEAAQQLDFAALRDEMRAELREEVRKEVIADLAPGKDEDPDKALARLKDSLNLEAFADVADLSQARDAMLTQIQGALKSEYDRMQKQAGSMLREMMSQIKRDQHVAELAERWTGGTDDTPHGLPVGREEVETFLLNLSDKQRAAAESILGRIWKDGLTEFSEIGHGRKVQGTAKLDPEIARQLKNYVTDGGQIADFFDAAGPILGDRSQYDLSAFEEKEGGK